MQLVLTLQVQSINLSSYNSFTLYPKTKMQKAPTLSEPEASIARLIAIVRKLRDPKEGCPWDIVQTFSSIAPHTIEEAYEVADAIERQDWDDLKSELGDLLFQSIFHAQIAEEKGLFSFCDVVDNMSEKMVARHPHVFGDELRNKTMEQQSQDWETIKAKERIKKSQKGVLDGVAKGLPALVRSLKLQKRAARVGFDWLETKEIFAKISEEIDELKCEIDSVNLEKVEEEFGDVLFVLTNLGRRLRINPETALSRANTKFTQRFEWIESMLLTNGRDLTDCSLNELNELWKQAKLNIG